MNVEPDFINQACHEKRFGKFAATHQANVFASLLFQVTGEPGSILGNEFNIALSGFFQRA